MAEMLSPSRPDADNSLSETELNPTLNSIFQPKPNHSPTFSLTSFSPMHQTVGVRDRHSTCREVELARKRERKKKKKEYTTA